MSNKQIAALMAVRAFAGTNTVSADNEFADGVAAANRHVINHIDYLITQVQAGHEVPFVVEHESRFPFQGKVTSEPQPTDRHALQAEGRHPAPCARFCEANAFQIEIRQLSAQLEQADRQRVPEGYVLVPVEPTCDMLAAMSGEWHPSRHGKAREQYAAMLAAAPEAPAQASAVDERDRKDAERYRFIRDAARSDPHLPFQALLYYACESLDEAIDEAMQLEARAALAQKGGAA